MAILGKSIIVKIGSTAIAAAKSCSISTSCDLIETSSPTQNVTSTGTWRMFLTGRKEWEVSCDYLVTAVEDLLQVGQAVTLTIQGQTSGDSVSGQAICTQADVSGSIGALAKGSFKFKGNGELS